MLHPRYSQLAKLVTRLSINTFSVNLWKTNDMLFRSREPTIELHLKMNSVDIPRELFGNINI